MEYQKINTIFKRDSNNIIIPTLFTCDEFEYLKDCKWECTEKIDGTNMRIELFKDENDNLIVEYHGKTDKANIPALLLDRMKELFDNIDFTEIFPSFTKNDTITIYGEGYGKKIQNGGNYIKDGNDFILFDVRYNNFWLRRDALEDIANKLHIKIVPLIGYMNIQEAIEYVKKGFKSTIAENKDYDAEGLVLKTPNGLRFRNGDRIITKIKTCDFNKFKAKYGDDLNVHQELNVHYEGKVPTKL